LGCRKREGSNDYDKGSLKMIDIESFNKGLKNTFVKKYTDVNIHG